MMQRFALPAVLALVAALPFFNWVPGWTPAIATLAALAAILLVGLNIIFGMAGMLALGQAAFAAMAGYVSGMLLMSGSHILIALLSGFLITVLIAYALAQAFVRMPGIYLAFGTLGFAFVIEGLARAFPQWTGGASGLVIAPPFHLSGTGWYVVSLIALALAALSYALLIRGPYARTLSVVRYDELAASVLGIDVTRVKTNAFTIAAGYAAVAGLLIAFMATVVVPESGGVTHSLDYLAMLMIGGSGSPAGPFLGASLVNWLSAVAGRVGAASEMEALIYGIGFFTAAMFAPRGLAGLLPARRRLWTQPSNAAAPSAADRTKPLPGRDSGDLQLRHISKSFGGAHVLVDVSLDVTCGEVVVVVGPNGAGKTTLFNIISGIETANTGSLLLNEVDISKQSVHRRAQTIGRSFQVARLVPELSVLENVAVRIDQLQPRLSESERLTAAFRALERFKIHSLANTPAGDLSAGQQKLVDGVRAALGAPILVLFDEPAVGLSEAELSAFAEMIAEIKRSSAVLIVEHNFRFVARIADRAVVLDRGRIIAVGKIEEVMRNPTVREAYYGALA
jgi:branched-chain amino acid transport system permease protein